MSISIYVYSGRPSDEIDSFVRKTVDAFPEDYANDFVVSDVSDVDTRRRRSIVEHEFEAKSWFIVNLNNKSRVGPDLKFAVDRLVNVIGRDETLVLFENETVYDLSARHST